MLVKFTIDGGLVPIREQARQDVLDNRLRMLREHDPAAETTARESIRKYIKGHAQFTAKLIACTGIGDAWQPEFESLYEALAAKFTDERDAHEEAGKFLGLLVWNEALLDDEEWHFTKYPKLDSDLFVTHYYAVDRHIRASAKLKQASNARAHGDEDGATELEKHARELQMR
jgi:hypothetical protein